MKALQDTAGESLCCVDQRLLTLHVLPGYAPELNPDELVWSHMKRTGVARTHLRKGEKLQDKIEAPLADISIRSTPRLVRSFPKHQLSRILPTAELGFPQFRRQDIESGRLDLEN